MAFARFQRLENNFKFAQKSEEGDQRTVFIGNNGNIFPMRSADRRVIIFTDVSSYLYSQGLTLAEEDVETPSYVLDHMYAKKPREPGSHAPVKPRKKTNKRKEQALAEKFSVPDTPPPAPKINIIRQRLPNSVYNPFLTRPTILSSQKIKSETTSVIDVKAKASPSKLHVVHQRKSTKKEEPVKTTYSSFDELGKLFTTKSLQKNNWSSKANSSAIMEDLQSDCASYAAEMLFDFGIAETDEAALCADGFCEFDEFAVGMEVYPNKNHCKSPSLPNLSNQCLSTTYPQLLSEHSDDEDASQIMISLSNQQDWGSSKVFDQKKEPYQETELKIDVNFPCETTPSCPEPKVPKNDEPVKSPATVISPTRRSGRLTKSPGWLKDSSKIPLKRNRH